MTKPWFDPIMYAWIPGALLGVVGAIAGTLDGLCVSRGKCRTLVMGVHYTALVSCCLLLVAGIVALATGQPWGIWYGLGFPGLLGVIIFGFFTWFLRRLYTIAEMHKSMGKDL